MMQLDVNLSNLIIQCVSAIDMLGNTDRSAATHVNPESLRTEVTSVWRCWVRRREQPVALYHVLLASSQMYHLCN